MGGYFWNYDLDPEFPLNILKFTTRGDSDRIHWHNYLEIGLCTGGNGKFIFTNKEYDVRKGDVFIVSNFENHVAISEYNTSYGHQLFSVGNNSNAAYLSGVSPNLIRMLAYILSGVLSTLTGFFLFGYNTFVFVNMGSTYVLPSVAAVVIGGTAFAGGKGSFTGTMIGAVLLTTLASLLIVINTDEAGRQMINGLVLIMILALYTRQPSIRQ
jgi:predicted ABC-type sugar transport system permease subunit